MSYSKVSDLAKKYGYTNDQMLMYLLMNNIIIDDSDSEVDITEIADILNRLKGKNDFGEHLNMTSFKSIEIEGLFGKYDYSIEFNDDINIWVSENGQGKTTILNLIVALLNGDEKLIAATDFKKISIQIGNEKYKFIKEDITFKKIDYRKAERLFVELDRYLPSKMSMQIFNKFRMKSHIDIDEIEYLLRKHMRFYDWNSLDGDFHNERDYRYILKELNDLKKVNFGKELFKIKKSKQEEVLFYPTYRRIEISEDRIFQTNSRENKPTDYVKFGMKDVEESISKLMAKMSEDANNSYIEMNGAIISDLLSGESVQELSKNSSRIDKHKVEVVINRIGKERIEHLERLNDFVNGSLDNPNQDFLKFYLDRLVKIYDSQKAIDDKLSKFAAVCNKYLEPNKKITYDEALLSLNVYNSHGDKIEFSQLSSGEKQIVSIFSRVYLDVTSTCIMIIDEPELSLSIEWQKNLLEDIYKSGKVGLMIVTTHSPFIYKNDYRKYAREIKMLRKENS